MKSIRFWIVLFINLLVIFIVAILLVFSYKEFQNALNDRVLLQLTSIKRLKSVQIENYINMEWEAFIDASGANTLPQNKRLGKTNFTLSTNLMDTLCLKKEILNHQLETGIYDISTCTAEKGIKLAFVKKFNDKEYKIKIIDAKRIEEILLERTGMGRSGETYLVGEDLHLRSASRFFLEKLPHKITAKTVGVQKALSGKDSIGIFEDYRGVPVFSSYDKLVISNLHWAILSEIDVAEVTIPLQSMRNKLMIISIIVILLAIVLSSFIITIISTPILKMRDFLNSMSKGDYSIQIKDYYPVKEIKEMFFALDSLKSSIKQAIHFSTEIGKMNLKTEYQSLGKNDNLGKSLILMQKKLIKYKSIEKHNRLHAKQSLIRGQENERKRLSRELHDGLGPLLTSLKLTVQSSKLAQEDKAKINMIADKTIEEIRRMSYDLMPPALVDFGIGKALLNFVKLIKKSNGIYIVYEDGTKDIDSRPDTEIDICLFRICQELINNTLKHSNANKIVFSLTEFDDKFSLYYADNGSGFNIKEAKAGLGLRNIRERVEVFDGYLNITSGIKGTEVEVEIPISK